MNTTPAIEILDRLQQKLGFTKDSQLAVYLGVSAQAVSQARKKDKIPDGWLIKAALKGQISLDELLLGQPAAQKAASSQVAEENQFEVDFCMIPLVAARLSAGGGSLETEGEVLHHMAFRRDWVARKGNPARMVLMRVHGDSMEPYIQHGDLALIDQSRTSIIPHMVYAVGVDEGIYLKALETLPGQKLVLRSFNERYAPIEVDMRGDMAESIRIIGKVIWWCHEA